MKLQKILTSFGLDPNDQQVQPFGSGLINSTWRVSGKSGQFILQAINHHVFKDPQGIANNLQMIDNYLQVTSPGYLFPAPLPAVDGQYLVKAGQEYYRLLPFINGSHTVNYISHPQQAYEASKQFGKLTKLLGGFDTGNLVFTLKDFHNLSLRVAQFETALEGADAERLDQAKAEIGAVRGHMDIATDYAKLISGGELPLRVIHHDTKINNVLLNDDDEGLCVVDLDTIMPGYFFSDVGDMMRTYLSPVNEEEQDLDKISINIENFAAIYKGYMSEMGTILTPLERGLFIYSGKFMIFMQAVRFLTDFLNGDIYYPTHYAGHNLSRTRNQLALLDLYIRSGNNFQQIIDAASAE